MSSAVNTEMEELRILVATDNHLGFMEKHGERGEDSFTTFEEILQLAVEKEADFILLGGDLFHENKPSRNCVLKCMELLKKYCLGDRPVTFEYLSDPSQDFCMKEPKVNFHDANLNVAMPVFSIHGNHDDISGLGDTAALELLSAAGLVNYFGRWTDLKTIRLSPVLLQKGQTKLALYGLGNMKDERLYRTFSNGSFSMLRPKQDTDSWFNMFVLHQNRVKHSPKNYLPVEFLDDFLDLVVWGHEHDNRLAPEWQEQRKLYISQPGSSVATSLCDGEAKRKAVGLLHLRGKEFQMEVLPLRTVRPFVFRTLRLSECAGLDRTSRDEAGAVQEYISAYVDDLLRDVEEQMTGHPRQPTRPLVRLRVEYSDESQVFQGVRFGQQYAGRIANPEDIILLKRERVADMGSRADDVDGGVMESLEHQEDTRVEDFVSMYFSELGDGAGLHVLSEAIMACAVKHFVTKNETSAIEQALEYQLQKAVKELRKLNLLDVGEDNVREELDRLRERRKQKKLEKMNATAATAVSAVAETVDSEEEEMRAVLETSTASRQKTSRVVDIDSDFDDVMEIDEPQVAAPTRGGRRGVPARGGRGRAARGGAGDARPTARGRARGRATPKGMVPIAAAFAAVPRSSGGSSQSSRTVRASRTSSKGVMFDSDSDSDD